MLRHYIPIILFCFSPLSALGLSSSDIESMLTQSSLVFDNLSLSLLKFPKDKQHDEYLFSFCLSENEQWGVVAFGQSEGYRMSQNSQQIEALNCQLTISPTQFIELSFHISKADAKRTQWTLRRYRPCYSKKTNKGAVSICHAIPDNRDDQEGSAFWMNPYFYGFLMISATLIAENALLYVVWYAYTHAAVVSTCPKCNHQF